MGCASSVSLLAMPWLPTGRASRRAPLLATAGDHACLMHSQRCPNCVPTKPQCPEDCERCAVSDDGSIGCTACPYQHAAAIVGGKCVRCQAPGCTSCGDDPARCLACQPDLALAFNATCTTVSASALVGAVACWSGAAEALPPTCTHPGMCAAGCSQLQCHKCGWRMQQLCGRLWASGWSLRPGQCPRAIESSQAAFLVPRLRRSTPGQPAAPDPCSAQPARAWHAMVTPAVARHAALAHFWQATRRASYAQMRWRGATSAAAPRRACSATKSATAWRAARPLAPSTASAGPAPTSSAR